MAADTTQLPGGAYIDAEEEPAPNDASQSSGEEYQDNPEEEEQQESAAPAMNQQMIRRQLNRLMKDQKKNDQELDHWSEELASLERKKMMCLAALLAAAIDDSADIIADAVSFGMLGELLFPVPGLLRMMIASQERTPSTDSFLRSILTMAIKAIPVINALPVATLNIIIDIVQTETERVNADRKVSDKKKKKETLKKQIVSFRMNLSRAA